MPSSVWNRSPRSTPSASCAMACGWSPAGWKSETTWNGGTGVQPIPPNACSERPLPGEVGHRRAEFGRPVTDFRRRHRRRTHLAGVTHDLDARMAALAAGQHGLLTRAQARPLGIDRRAVARRLARRAARRAVARRAPARRAGRTWPQDLQAAVLAAGPGRRCLPSRGCRPPSSRRLRSGVLEVSVDPRAGAAGRVRSPTGWPPCRGPTGAVVDGIAAHRSGPDTGRPRLGRGPRPSSGRSTTPGAAARASTGCAGRPLACTGPASADPGAARAARRPSIRPSVAGLVVRAPRRAMPRCRRGCHRSSGNGPSATRRAGLSPAWTLRCRSIRLGRRGPQPRASTSVARPRPPTSAATSASRRSAGRCSTSAGTTSGTPTAAQGGRGGGCGRGWSPG